jgi:hypothetical protein
MKRFQVIAFVCLFVLGITTTGAQQEHQVLRFEFSKDGTTFATPFLLLKSGTVGRIHMDNKDAPNVPIVKGLRERIEVTPTVQNEDIALAFDIASADKRYRPTLVISKDVKGSLEWVTSEGQALRMTVAWVQ